MIDGAWWSFPLSIYYNTYLGQFVFLYPIPVYKRYSWGIATMIATPGVRWSVELEYVGSAYSVQGMVIMLRTSQLWRLVPNKFHLDQLRIDDKQACHLWWHQRFTWRHGCPCKAPY